MGRVDGAPEDKPCAAAPETTVHLYHNHDTLHTKKTCFHKPYHNQAPTQLKPSNDAGRINPPASRPSTAVQKETRQNRRQTRRDRAVGPSVRCLAVSLLQGEEDEREDRLGQNW